MDIALEDGTAFSGPGFQYIKPAFAEGTVHFIGLLSDGGAPDMPSHVVARTRVPTKARLREQ